MAETPIIEGPGKGRVFFDHAKTVAASGNFDYAVTLYIDGLLREPTNLEQHQALYEVSLRRKFSGAKKSGGMFGPKLPCKGKTPKELMINAEWQLANDPGTINNMLTMVRQAMAAEYGDIVRWLGPIVLLANKTKPRKEICLEMADIYEKLNTGDDLRKAADCIRGAMDLSPGDMTLDSRIKDLSAKLTLMEGQYEKDDDFKHSLKSKDETKKLAEEDNLAKSEEHRRKLVSTAKAEYEQNPMDHQLISKYAKTLVAMDEEGGENTAIEVLDRAYKETKTYRYRLSIGDIKIKQFNRNLRMMEDALKMDPDDKELVEQVRHLRKEKLTFELDEFKQRVLHYPTEMGYQFELGKRYFETKHYDEAIGALQLAQNNSRIRAGALHLLGRAFLIKELRHEAIETLKRSVESYELAETGDGNSKNYYYWLGIAYEENNNIGEAMAVYSKIMQWDYNYKDVRQRLEKLRNLQAPK